jgi:hypothetical protein
VANNHDEICDTCGERYGKHYNYGYGIDCPDSEGRRHPKENNGWLPSGKYATKEEKSIAEIVSNSNKVKPIGVRIREGM